MEWYRLVETDATSHSSASYRLFGTVPLSSFPHFLAPSLRFLAKGSSDWDATLRASPCTPVPFPRTRPE